MPTKADLLADLLDGAIDASEVPAELAELASLADAVSEHITLVPPTDAFRSSLREDVLQAAGGQAAAGGAAAGGAATAGGATTAASGGLSAIVVGVAATAVLAAGTVTAADRSGPGDLLAGLDRGIESVQLALVGEGGAAALLVDIGAERVLEALDVVDVAVVDDLLAEAESRVQEALDIAIAQGADIEALVGPYVDALRTLASRTDDPEVLARVRTLLGAVGAEAGVIDDAGSAGDVDAPTTDATEGGEPGGADSGAADDAEGSSGDDSARVTDEPTDTVDDAIDDTTDAVDDAVGDAVDDVGDAVDDAVDDVGDALDGLGDEVGGATGDTPSVPTPDPGSLTDGLQDTTDDVTSTIP